ncbi:MAG: GNAT family N-acetyltransferase [Natronomonas sp.]
MEANVTVRQVEGEPPEAAISIRRSVFVDEQGVPESVELDGHDEEAVHFLADHDGRPVGVARMRPKDGTAKAERVAVVSDRRGEGIGRRLMEAVESRATAEGYGAVVLSAQTPVVEFYKTLGYDVVSEEYLEAGIPHRRMRKQLSANR